MANPTLLQLRTELLGRGTDYLSVSRANWFINAAHNELCEAYLWPFLETTATITVPSTSLTDVRAVASVNDATTGAAINYADRRSLALSSTVFSTTGTPSVYFFEGENITTYPVAPGAVTVRYFRSAQDLVADTDQVIVPSRWKDLLMDGAMIRVYKDSDNFEEVAALRQEYDRQVHTMYTSYFSRQLEPDHILVTQLSDWHC
jgi:hypothetical protein